MRIEKIVNEDFTGEGEARRTHWERHRNEFGSKYQDKETGCIDYEKDANAFALSYTEASSVSDPSANLVGYIAMDDSYHLFDKTTHEFVIFRMKYDAKTKHVDNPPLLVTYLKNMSFNSFCKAMDGQGRHAERDSFQKEFPHVSLKQYKEREAKEQAEKKEAEAKQKEEEREKRRQKYEKRRNNQQKKKK